ncbi:MAG TPA: bacteriohopanetetrol glucosamine biosynthesis glycosyltransferase HpnI [Candidatus Rubrimentiphilum sp.]|nr:bacteriohopanetetrol glucosamine biosynthesis glycosyltransferase HpnI [Candidatus Rubrimentiphilum sp.]
MNRLLRIAEYGALALAAAGISYTAFAISRVRSFRKHLQPAPGGAQPPMTILKPLYGEEPLLYENLRSFCEQVYPQHQVIFGARSPNDPALEIARRLVRDLPGHDLSAVVTSDSNSPNPKIANLIGMLPTAKYDILVIADSDIRVGPAYLSAISAAVHNSNVGAVTCLYGGTPSHDLAAQLGALFVNDRFVPSVLVATALEPLTYCFGATMAVRRDVLEQIGGLEALAGNLGDDYVLGKLVSDAGHRVALCPYVVQTTVTDTNLENVWRHQLRWQRTIRASRPAGFAGSLVTYGLPLAAIAALLSRSPVTAGATLSAALTLRYMLHFEARKTFAPHVDPPAWLVPLSDLFSLATWAASFFADDVSWRGSDFRIDAHGKIDE